MYKNLGVIGAGAWGTALAVSGTRAGLKAQIWAFEKDVVDSCGCVWETWRAEGTDFGVVKRRGGQH